MKKTFYVGTRGSQLALWQANAVVSLLKKAYPDVAWDIKIFSTTGDLETEKPLPAIAGFGVFTKALDEALLRQEIDLAVHSEKDLPIGVRGMITTAAVLKREKANDVVVSKGNLNLFDAPSGAIIGTSSTRRSSQLLAMKKGLVMANIRGNVETRIKKVLDETSVFQSTILAYAGVKRLKLLNYCAQILDFEQMLPAPAQGSIAIQCLIDSQAHFMCRAINHIETRLCTEAERGFLFGLGGGCSMPVAAYAQIEKGTMAMRGKVLSLDGTKVISLKEERPLFPTITFEHAFEFGVQMATRAVEQGAKELLSSI